MATKKLTQKEIKKLVGFYKTLPRSRLKELGLTEKEINRVRGNKNSKTADLGR